MPLPTSSDPSSSSSASCSPPRSSPPMIMDASDIIEISGGAVWSEKNEQNFIQLMEIEVINGNRQTTTFNPAAWSRITQGLEAATKKQYKQKQMRNKFNSLRTRWRNFSNLLKKTGIGYNATTGQVIASEDVWSKLYKVNKSAKTFHKKGCPLYETLCRIYGDTTATGSLQRPSTKISSDTEEEETEESQTKSVNGSMDKETYEDNAFMGKLPSKRVKKTNMSEIIVNIMQVMSENSKRRVDMMEKKMNMSSKSSSQSSKSLVIECMSVLNLIEDIDDVSYFKTLQKFQEDSMWMAIFLHMPDSRRKSWILSLK